MSHPADHPHRRGPKAPPTLLDDSQQFEDQVRDLIGELLGLDVDEVPIDASFFEDLGADSLDIVELSPGFQAGFAISVSVAFRKCRNALNRTPTAM